MKIAAMVATMALTLSLGACHGVMAPNSSAAGQQPLSPGEGMAGKAHLHVYLGRVHGPLFSHANGRESGFYINGVDVGTVNPGEFLYVELEPGVYDFSWQGRHDFFGATASARDYDVLQPDQDVFLALNVDNNAGAWLGPIGWWLDPATGHIADTFPLGSLDVADRRMVRPSAAVLAQLHPIAGPATYLPASW